MNNCTNLSKLNQKRNFSRRKPEYYSEGRHKPLYGVELFNQNQQIRKSKNHNSGSVSKNNRIYILSGISRCYECWEKNPQHPNVSLRGVTGKNHIYYRCAAQQERYTRKRIVDDSLLPLTPAEEIVDLFLCHKSLPANKLEEEIQKLLVRIQIPEEWMEIILSYVVTNYGMTDYERNNFNLSTELDRLQKLYLWGDLSEADYVEASFRIKSEIENLKPSHDIAAKQAIPLLADFPRLWSQLLPIEQKVILKTMFAGLYFDAKGDLRKIIPQPLFNKMITGSLDNQEKGKGRECDYGKQ